MGCAAVFAWRNRAKISGNELIPSPETIPSLSNLLSIIVAAALVNNVILVQFLGVSSLFAYSNRLQSALELAMLSFFVLLAASFTNLLLYRWVLHPLGLEVLKLVVFVTISSGLSTWLALIIERHYPLSMQRHRLAFALVGGNSAVLGVALLNSVSTSSIIEAFAYSLGAATGFAFVLIGFAALRQRLETADSPAAFRGFPINLISAGIVAMCLLGFAGLV